MSSVTNRIQKIEQPRGGFVNKKEFEIIMLEDGCELLSDENIDASLIGMAIEYLTRWCLGMDLKNAFEISLKGANNYDIFTKMNSATKNAENFLKEIVKLDEKAVVSACKLVGYDVCYRRGIEKYKPVEEINPNSNTINNIITMVERSLYFFEKYGPIIKCGFNFDGGYTEIIEKGDGDFVTKDTIWDFKVLKGEPTSKDILQLVVYYIMGCHSKNAELKEIQKIGLFNPRKNKIYLLEVKKISKNTICEIERNVIGY